jgi:DNA/RNA-binding domain of Phe-tRNA-synthetase-like protein
MPPPRELDDPGALPVEGEGAPEAGWIEPALADEFPGLAVRYTTISAKPGRSPRSVKDRLRTLSDRFHGGHAVNLRQRPIPWAYRVFFRHIGLDPDEQPTPIEELALERMKRGRFRSENRVDDALTIAIVESGVAMRAFDADRIEGRLGLRASTEGETLEGRPTALPTGTLVIADEARILALLFGAMAAGRGVTKETERITLVALQVQGVPEISVEEAVWIAATVLTSG